MYEFIENLRETFPESESIKKIVGITRNTKTIRNVVDRLQDNSTKIKTQDETLFIEEPVYLLPGVNFTPLFLQPGLTQTSKTAIWQYLNLLLFTGNMIVGDGLLSPEDAAVAEFMNTMKKFSESVSQAQSQSPPDEAIHEKQSRPPSPAAAPAASAGKSMNLIESLANDLANELKLPDDLQTADPMQLFQSLMSDKSNLAGVLSKAGQTLQNKMESGEVTQESILKETQQMMASMSEMSKTTPGMPDVGSIMQGILDNKDEGLNPTSIMQNLSKVMSSIGGGAGAEAGPSSNPLALLSGLMGSGEDEMPDLSDIQAKVRKEMRKQYKQDQEANKARATTQRAALKNKFQARNKQNTSNEP